MDEPAVARLAQQQARPAESQGGEKSRPDLFQGSGKELDRILGVGDRKSPRESALPFAASLAQHLKAQAPEAKDVYLDGARPEQMRAELLGEVTNGVQLHAVKGGGEMRLVIHPEEMGEVKLRIAAARDGKVEVHVTAENKEVAELIRSGSSDLKSSLSHQNLELARFEVTVSDHAVSSLEPKGSLSEQLLQQNPQNGFQQSGGDGGRFARWDGGDQRQGSRLMAQEENHRGEPAGRRAPAVRYNPVRDGSRRLDVVA
jgi:flagellar hook-length control protein FliK